MMNDKLSVFAFNTVRAPYRVDLYNELGKQWDLTACFEQKHDPTRSENWYANNFETFSMTHAKRWDKSLKCVKWDVIFAVKKKYDLVYMSEWSSVTALILMLKCVLLRIPYLLSMDGYIENRNSKAKFLKRMIKRFFASHAIAAVGTGSSTREYAISIGFSKDKIYSVGFTSLSLRDLLNEFPSCKEKQEIKRKLLLHPDKNYVLSVGQLVYRKGVDLLLSAWENMNRNNNWELLIIGDGESQEEYLEMVRRNHISNVSLLSGREKKELFEYYKAADIFVLNTREDIWGLVINEAMANGLPILTTKQCVSGVELIEEGKNGFLYHCEDVEACEKYLSELMNDSDARERMGKHNLEKIKDYTIEREAEKIIDIVYLLKLKEQRKK